MMAGTHPDWHVLQPEKGKSTLGIEPVRQVIEQLQNHAQQGAPSWCGSPAASSLAKPRPTLC